MKTCSRDTCVNEGVVEVNITATADDGRRRADTYYICDDHIETDLGSLMEHAEDITAYYELNKTYDIPVSMEPEEAMDVLRKAINT